MANNPSGIPDNQWIVALQEARELLIECARRGTTITYSDLASDIHAVDVEARDPRLDELLSRLSTSEYHAGRGMLSVLVVHKQGDQMPGPGFFELADALGVPGRDKEEIWIKQFNRVTDYWKSQPQ